jgi:hypothetical protein
MRRVEQNFQKAVATLLHAALPDDAWSSAFPAGGGGRLRGAILKSMGLAPGVPDYIIAHAGRTLWLELKTHARGSGLSATQRACHERLRAAGHAVEVVRDIVEVIRALDAHGVPHRLSITGNGCVI